jgi:hypothetical protein
MPLVGVVSPNARGNIAALNRLLQKSRNRSLERGWGFQWWRVSVWFVQPADDGRTYLARAFEERSGPPNIYTHTRGWPKALINKLIGESEYQRESRVSNPLFIALGVQAWGGYRLTRRR